MILQHNFKLITLIMCTLFIGCQKSEDIGITNEFSEPVSIVSDLLFAEGPAYYNGNLYFSDIEANKIYKWNESDGLSVFEDNSGGANGLYFDNSGNLFVCEGGNKRVVTIDSEQKITVIADEYNGKPFNEPNDLWVSPIGNVYFTDPVYTGTLSQDGEYVYCALANGSVLKVADDLIKPNGIVGNSSGTALYIADHGAKIIYSYSILSNGTLTNKQVFANVQADGLTIDSNGNIYAASDAIRVYNSKGELSNTIEIPGTLTNLFIGSIDKKTLFITTHNQVYKLQLNN